MENGYVGLVIWCRDSTGAQYTHKSYSLLPCENERHLPLQAVSTDDGQTAKHEEAARRAYGFWEHCLPFGTSDYLIRKGGGYYGIRFRSSKEYGNVGVVPIRDESGKLWGYQLLNQDGSKRMPKGAKTRGLFHELQEPIDGQMIGVSESYVTAATCFQLSGLPMIYAFSCANLLPVALVVRKLYQKSHVVFFADNDRHLEVRGLANEGVLSDWNDLYRFTGEKNAKAQILNGFGAFPLTFPQC